MIKKCPFQGHLIFLRGCHFILSLPYSGEIAFMEETLPFALKYSSPSLCLFESHNYNMLYIFSFFLATSFPHLFFIE